MRTWESARDNPGSNITHTASSTEPSLRGDINAPLRAKLDIEIVLLQVLAEGVSVEQWLAGWTPNSLHWHAATGGAPSDARFPLRSNRRRFFPVVAPAPAVRRAARLPPSHP